MRATAIRKSTFREQVHAALLRLILQGRWAPGERWNDSALAAELGVSRTPVREAMIQLEAEGLVTCDPNRGFHLPALRPQQAREIYPLLWSLEQLAVFLFPLPAAELRVRLETAAGRSTISTNPAEMAGTLKQDRAWHLALAAASGNAHLAALHLRLEALSRRYAAALPPAASFAERNAREHAQILDALASEQPARAHALLKMHWRAEMEAVLAVLAGEQAAPSAAGRGARSAAAGLR